MGDLAVELDDARRNSRELLLDQLDLGLHLLLSGSEDDNLGLVANLVEGGEEDIDSLLLLEASDESKDGDIRVDRESGLPLQRRLGVGLSRVHGLRVVLEAEELVQGRVPVGNVHTVDDTLAPLLGDNVVQLDSQLRAGGHLLGVGRGHGKELVAGGDSGAEPVLLGEPLSDGALVDLGGRGLLVEDHRVSVLEREPLPGALREVEVTEGLRPEPALEGDVVDGVGHLGVDKPASRLHHVLDVDRDQGRVPVVGDDHGVLTRHERERGERLERGLAEQGETLLVVDVVGSRLLSVELRSGLSPDLGQEPRMIHPNAVDAVLDGVEEADVLAVDVHDDRGIPGVEVLVVTRGDGEDVVAALGELDREGPGDVAETSGLGPRRDLGGDEHNVEELGGQGRLGRRGHHRGGELLDGANDGRQAGRRGGRRRPASDVCVCVRAILANSNSATRQGSIRPRRAITWVSTHITRIEGDKPEKEAIIDRHVGTCTETHG